MTSGPVVFMGTPAFSVPFLDAILISGREIALVITQPDKPKGRGQKLMPPPVKEFAITHNIPVLQPQKLSEPFIADAIKEINPEFIVVVAYGKIIPSVILKIPSRGCINVHASILPEFRGASPIQWAIIKGCNVSGVTTMLMDETLDTGDMLLQETLAVERTDTAGSLSLKLAEIGPAILIKTLAGLETGEIVPVKQDHTKASYAPLIKKEDGIIKWNDSSENIYNKIHGFDPWPGTYTYYKGKRWGIWKAEVIPANENSEQKQEVRSKKQEISITTEIPPPLTGEGQGGGEQRLFSENQRDKNVPPILNFDMDRRGFPTPPEGFLGERFKQGKIIDVQANGIIVSTGDCAIKLTEIQPEGKRRMRVEEYLRGHKVEKGVVLGDETGNIDSD
ncbi:MAG: methionyl-tRNA formyltransferase [Nitrospirae bacterium]|nr:methionyl-tRNA formyltransferase [Nitrospirota bacterium]